MTHSASSGQRQSLIQRFHRVREATEALVAGLSAEDMAAQSMPDASPAKWHLAHTTWFFSTFLAPREKAPAWAPLFNSYYETLGRPFPRPRRGLLTRPSLAEVMAWRTAVTEATGAWLERSDAQEWARLEPLLALGLAHEEQHQELILTDILHLFFQNPLLPAARPHWTAAPASAGPLDWVDFAGGLSEIGHDGAGFAFDNEGPRHRVHVNPWRLASRLVTNGEYRDFIADGGYRRPELWLSEGWALVQADRWAAPLYWLEEKDAAQEMTLAGAQPLIGDAPVAHVSYFEADAFARWANKRLPTEAEWELAAGSPVAQMFGAAWQWTASPYSPYPGFKPASGALGEYNGKFMINQMVLKGSSAFTPAGHSRSTYRNFFPAAARWQRTGIRLAGDA